MPSRVSANAARHSRTRRFTLACVGKPDVVDQQLVFENPVAHHGNWKASVENYSECYHCAPVHGLLTSTVIDPNSYPISANALVPRHVVDGRDGLMTQRLSHFWPGGFVTQADRRTPFASMRCTTPRPPARRHGYTAVNQRVWRRSKVGREA